MSKRHLLPLLLSIYLAPAVAGEAIIINEEKEHVGGSVIGGSSLFLIGGALSGGPVGALAGGLIGAFSGANLQEQSELSGRAYKVQYDDGHTEVLRSPNHQFANGDKVAVVNNRPKPLPLDH